MEILVSIFRILQDDTPHHPVTPSIICSHVCQFWRACALACPQLWLTLNLKNPGSAEIAANRSGELPLSISYREEAEEAEAERPEGGEMDAEAQRTMMSLAWLKSCANRITAIQIHACPSTIQHMLSFYLFYPLPLLTTLSLTQRPFRIGSNGQWDIPNCRKLYLDGVRGTFKSHFKNTITHLSLFNHALIQFVGDHNEMDTSIGQLDSIFTLIKHCTLLEELTIVNTLFTFDSDPPNLPSRLQLPRLRRVLLDCVGDFGTYFFRNVSIFPNGHSIIDRQNHTIRIRVSLVRLWSRSAVHIGDLKDTFTLRQHIQVITPWPLFDAVEVMMSSMGLDIAKQYDIMVDLPWVGIGKPEPGEEKTTILILFVALSQKLRCLSKLAICTTIDTMGLVVDGMEAIAKDANGASIWALDTLHLELDPRCSADACDAILRRVLRLSNVWYGTCLKVLELEGFGEIQAETRARLGTWVDQLVVVE